MGIRRPSHRPQGHNSPQSGTYKTFDLDLLPEGKLAAMTDHPVPIPGIQFIQTFEQVLNVIDRGRGTEYADGHVISVTAEDEGGIAVAFTESYSTIRFAYSWGQGSRSTVRVYFFNKDSGEDFTYIDVKKTGPAQWIEHTSPTGRNLMTFSLDFSRDGGIDNISAF